MTDPKHPLHYLLPPVKVSHSQMFFVTYIPISASTWQSYSLWMRFCAYYVSKKF